MDVNTGRVYATREEAIADGVNPDDVVIVEGRTAAINKLSRTVATKGQMARELEARAQRIADLEAEKPMNEERVRAIVREEIEARERAFRDVPDEVRVEPRPEELAAAGELLKKGDVDG